MTNPYDPPAPAMPGPDDLRDPAALEQATAAAVDAFTAAGGDPMTLETPEDSTSE